MPHTEITYSTSSDWIEPSMLAGFFDGWPEPPSAETHLRLLRGSSHVVLALDGGRVVGFVNAISDGFFAASIPLLEVLPTHRGRGIGRELVRRLLDQLSEFYSVDLACDPATQEFYQQLGLRPSIAMMRRNYQRQATGAG